MTIDEAVSIMVDRIATQFKPEKIILFGSQARGTAATDSHIDLLVVFPTCENRRKMTISIMSALRDLPVTKDIVVTTFEELDTRGKLKSTVLFSALEEGKVVYAA